MNKGFRTSRASVRGFHKYAAGNQPIEAWPPVADTDLAAPVVPPVRQQAIGINVTDDDALDRKLQDFVSKPTYVSQLRKAAKRKVIGRDEMSFANEVIKHWYTYLLLGFSAVFSLMLGVYMGLAPKTLPNGDLYFHTDTSHMILAIVYGLGFVMVTEGAFGLGKWLYYTREIDNKVQASSMLVMMTVAGVSILGTGIAGGIVIASVVDFLSAFVSVPEWAQYWVVRIIPALIVLDSLLLTVYSLASSEAETYRMLRARNKEHELDARAQEDTLNQWANYQIKKAKAKRFINLVESGAMSSGDALAAMDAEDSLSVPERAGASRPTNGGRQSQ